jgi:pimeloyl-ACP methyl ester carboxylesterase
MIRRRSLAPPGLLPRLLPGLLLTLCLAAAPRREAAAQLPLLAQGKTIDFVYDARDTRHFEEAYTARLFLPREARAAAGPREAPLRPLPLVVFLHGVNPAHTRFRLVGGKPDEPDVRLVIGGMVRDGIIPPVILAAPTTVVSADIPVGLWPGFDLDRFVERTARALRGQAAIDLERVVVVGHSGGGCNTTGGLYTSLAGTSLRLRAVVAIDVCMAAQEARLLARAPASTDVLVTYQPLTWKRPFDEYRAAFAEAPTPPGALRLIEELSPPSGVHAHDAMVELTLRKHLAALLARTGAQAPGGAAGSAQTSAAP